MPDVRRHRWSGVLAGVFVTSLAASLAVALAPSIAATLGAQAIRTPAPSQLYQPRTVKQAYARGTRSPDGRPGSRYWQNRARYAMTITVTPPERTIRGTEEIVYVNASPDTLRRVAIKLFLNIHKPGAPRNGGASPNYLTDGMRIDRFAVEGTPQNWGNDTNVFTVRLVPLPAPVAPNDSVRLSFDWHYDISREANREGMTTPTTFYLAYFYPRVAVYDDLDGWDTMDFTDTQEFYSDFNDYDVTIRAPANFVVWGTGTLTNPADVLQPETLRRYQASLTSDTVIRVATSAELAAKTVTAQQQLNSWRFTSRNVPDVAFNVSDHYLWDAASVVADSTTNRRVSVQAGYSETAADFRHMVRFGQDAVRWFSRSWPGVPYPYEKTSIVQGFADMEYPMMVNDGSFPDTTFSRFVAEHEIAHTWFPFYMGINETRYGFMDEGWATALEYLRNEAKMGTARATAFFKEFRVEDWINDPSPLGDLPIITPQDVLKGVAYGNNAYGKSALGYLALKDLLGDAMFRQTLHAFMERWNGKHPLPWDYFNTVNDVSKQNLDWFFDAWFFRPAYIDIAVAGVQKTAAGYSVTLDNVGGMPAPVDLVIAYTDGSTETRHQTPAIWKAHTGRAVVALATRKPVTRISLAAGIFMDAQPGNDAWSAK